MGQRNNYILIDEKESPHIGYAHWDAPVIGRKLFYGPEELKYYITNICRNSSELGLIDETFAEGGLILDFTQQKVLIWGEEYIEQYPIILPYFCKMLEGTLWQGWEIKWAFYGQLEMAKYLGKSAKNITILESEQELKTKAELLQSINEQAQVYEYTLVIRRQLTNYHYYLVPLQFEELMCNATSLQRLLHSLPSLTLSEALQEDKLRSFMYLDTLNKVLHLFWTNSMQSLRKERLAEYWQGWQVILEKEGWQWLYHKFVQEDLPKPFIVKKLTDMIGASTDNANPSRAIIQRLVEQFRNAGHQVQVSNDRFQENLEAKDEDAHNNRIIELWHWIDQFKKGL